MFPRTDKSRYVLAGEHAGTIGKPLKQGHKTRWVGCLRAGVSCTVFCCLNDIDSFLGEGWLVPIWRPAKRLFPPDGKGQASVRVPLSPLKRMGRTLTYDRCRMRDAKRIAKRMTYESEGERLKTLLQVLDKQAGPINKQTKASVSFLPQYIHPYETERRRAAYRRNHRAQGTCG